MAADGPETRFWRELLRRRFTHRWGNFSWVSLNALLLSANDAIAKRDATIVNTRRMRWVAAQRARGLDPAQAIWLPNAERLLALGDPGEMDGSQYVLVRDLAQTHAKVLLLMSDIVYPAGNIDAWRDAVYLPYLGLPEKAWSEANEAAKTKVKVPDWHVFAMPGNHDWYDGLTGFMYHACGAEPLPNVTFSAQGLSPIQRLTRHLWQEPARPDRATLAPLREQAAARWKPRSAPGPMPFQPGPYFALDLGKAGARAALRVVTVDTGVDGSIDVEQALWLREMLVGSVPKIVVTGKPVVTGDRVSTMPIRRALARGGREEPSILPEGLRELITEGTHVVATVAGDIHNSQRFAFAGAISGKGTQTEPARLSVNAETIAAARGSMLPPVQIVAGGGGAYLSETHTTPLDSSDGLTLQGDGVALGVLEGKRHTRFPDRRQSVELFGDRAGPWPGWVLIAIGLVALAAAIAVAVLDEAGSKVHVGDGTVNELTAVLAPFALIAVPLLFWQLMVAWGISPKPLLRLAITAILLCLAGWIFWITWNEPFERAPVLLAAVGFALAAPLLPVLIPVLQFFPSLARLVPLRTIAVALGGVIIQQRTELLPDTVGGAIVALTGLTLVVVGVTSLIPRLLQVVDDLAIEREAAPLRALLALASLWPTLLIVAAIFALPKSWTHAKEVAGMIVLIELLIVLVLLSGFVTRIVWRTRRFAPYWVLLGTIAVAVLCGAAMAAVAVAAIGQWWLTVLFGAAGVLLGAAAWIGGVLVASTGSVLPGTIDAALRCRDGASNAPDRDRTLFRLMTVAAVPGISEIAEAAEPPFRKGFLEIGVTSKGDRTTEIEFIALGLDDEREDDAQTAPAADPRARGAYVVDRLILELDLPAETATGTGV